MYIVYDIVYNTGVLSSSDELLLARFAVLQQLSSFKVELISSIYANI